MRGIQLWLLLLAFALLLLYSIYERWQDDTRQHYEQDYAYQLYLVNREVPQKIFFLDEEIPIFDAQIRERFAREMYLLTYSKPYTLDLLQRARYWLPIFEKILRSYQLPSDFKYLVVIESGLQNVVSPAGAAGFWQLLPETGRLMGLRIDEEVDERYHPIKSAHAAARYLNLAYQEIGNWTYVAAAYNAGIGAMRYAIGKQQAKSYYYMVLNPETSRYVLKAAAFKEIYEHPAKYGFELPIAASPPLPYKVITVRESIASLQSFAQQQKVDYAMLRRLNPWLIAESLSLKEGASYDIHLPVKSLDPITSHIDSLVIDSLVR